MKVLYSGCSYSSGVGFGESIEVPDNKPMYTDSKDSEYIWTNLVHKEYFPKYQYTNIATGGNTNLRIFQMTAKELLEKDYNFAFVQWTQLLRYEYEIGFELYSTKQMAKVGVGALTHNLRSGTYYAKDIQKRHDGFFTLEHEQYRIVELIRYINILCGISKLKNTKIYFVNGMCPWDNNFFKKQDNIIPESFTEYTKELLQINIRNEEESVNLYNKMHNQYKDEGHIQNKKWLNLYNSMRNNRIDTNKDGKHPGILSHKNYFKEFSTKLESVLQ